MLILKLLSLSAFVTSWLYARQHTKASIADVFVIALLAIIAPPFVFNPTGASALYDQSFTPGVVFRAQVGVSCTLIVGSILFLLKKQLGQRTEIQRIEVNERTLLAIKWWAIALAAIIFVTFTLTAEFRDFRIATTRFILGDLSGPEYRSLRGETYSNTLLLDGILGRFRYAVFPILFAVPLIVFIEFRQWLVGALFSVVFFLALPMSLSKLPIVFFCGYIATTIAATRGGVSLTKLVVAAITSVMAVVLLLSLLYIVQYWGAFQEGSIQPISLAIERIWGEPNSVALRYFMVYPDMASYTGVSGINLLAKALGVVPRLPELEVVNLAIGQDSGSNPGIFFLAGYASFGFSGLLTFAAIGFGVIFSLDEIAKSLKTQFCFTLYMAIMPINCLFLLQIALQTSLMTYGLAFIPLMIFVFDRVLERHHKHQYV